MILRQDEGALAGQWLGQGPQAFFLDKIAVDDIGPGQLLAELLQVERIGQPWNAE
ncbi:hypothetical protein D3C78_1989410 [compost metagenome]